MNSFDGALISASSHCPFSSAAALAPAMIVSVPSAARPAPPETGASMKKMSSLPILFNSCSTLCA